MFYMLYINRYPVLNIVVWYRAISVRSTFNGMEYLFYSNITDVKMKIL